MIKERKRSGTLRIRTEIEFLKGTKTFREEENYHRSTTLCMVNVKIYPERTGALRGNKPKQSAISLYEEKPGMKHA